MIPDDKKLLLLELGDSVGRSWWTIVAGVCIGLSLGIVAVKFAPFTVTTFSVPETLAAPSGTATTASNADPVARWQSLQWQTPMKIGSARAV